jgi:serine protease
VYVTRGLDNNGGGRESDILAAVLQCESSGAKIISLSIGGSSLSTTFTNELTRLYANGILIFAAAGNDGANVAKYPAAHPRVISVAAVKEGGVRWDGSNWNSQVELAAPGDMVLSTSVNSVGAYTYAYYSGTSMATPHAAGVAALVWSHFPQCTNSQIRYALAVSAKDVGDSGCDQKYGYGIVQAASAYNWLRSHPCQGASWGRDSTPDGGCTIV